MRDEWKTLLDTRTRSEENREGDLRVALAYPKWRFALPPVNLTYAMEVVGYEFGRRLAQHADVVLYRRGRRSEPESQVLEGVEYRRVGAVLDSSMAKAVQAREHLLKRLGAYDPGRPFTSSIFTHLGYATNVAKDTRRWGADVVHINIYDGLIPVLRRLNPDAKIVLHMHDHSQVQRDRETVRRHLVHADLIVGCSRFVTERVKERFPELASRCRTIWNAVDTDLYAERSDEPADRPPTVLFYGRISPEKGQHLVLQAFRRVIAEIPSARLVIIGQNALAGREFVDPLAADPLFRDLDQFWGKPAAYQEYLESLIGDDWRANVQLMGAVPNQTMINHLHSADVLVFPSLWHEPFGLPVIEAMSAGLPVVASRGGAFPETIADGETGLLVERGDVDELADALTKLLRDAELRQAMGRAGARRARELFSWDSRIDEWVAAYQTLLRQPT